MGKKASLSDVQRAQIVTLHKEGYSERKIAVKICCSKTAVHTAISKFENEGSYSDKKRTGRPRKTTKRDDNLMKLIVSRSPTSSCKKVQANLLQKGCEVSVSTVSRRLSKEFELKSYKPVKKMTPAMRKKRLDFARRHQTWTVGDWNKVMFSDESTFQQFTSRQQHVRRPVGKRFDVKYTIPTMKHPPSQMIWGAFSHNGTAGLYFLPQKTTMNGERYLGLLKEKLDIHMTIHKCAIFMHDGAPCHRSRVVQGYLAEKNIQVLEWPGNSPDLNPIENLWSVMKQKVSEKQPSSLKSLEQAIKEVWVK
jgi:transposase